MPLVRIESYYMTVKDAVANDNRINGKLREWLGKFPKDQWNHSVNNSVPGYTTYYVAKK